MIEAAVPVIVAGLKERGRMIRKTRAPLVIAALFTLGFTAQQLRAQDGAQQYAELGSCKLQSGRVIEQCRIGYRIFGKLNSDRSNAVLFPTYFNGRSEDLVEYFGPGRMVDTSRFFGVAIDAIGDGISSSPSNSKTQHATGFPGYTIRDMVDAEYRLATEFLNLRHVHAVVGISMGGMQIFDWIMRYPDFMNAAVSIVGSPQETSYDLWWAHLLEQAIQSAPGYAGGNYTAEPDVRMAREVGGLVFQSPAWRVVHTTPAEFPKVYVGLGGPGNQDANDTVWELQAIMTQDVTGGRSIATAARQAKAHLLVEVSQNDHAVNPQPAIAWAKASDASLYVSQTECGHNYWDCDKAKIEALAHDFLVTEWPAMVKEKTNP